MNFKFLPPKLLMALMILGTSIGPGEIIASTEVPEAYTSPEVDITVRGQVISSADGQPIPGASVTVKGTTRGVPTNMDGEFEITVPDQNSVLVISFIGFVSQEITVGNRTIINVNLQEDVSSLDEVVVVGYGTQRRSDITGAISVVNTDEMKKVATNDLAQMLQGRVSGVQVTSDGQPGAFPSVRIRGISTFGNAQPLYVIDGVPVGTTPRDFNPNDIETMQVLKDASAGAIYGSRAANGVVIITTKQGKKNTPVRVEFNSYGGIDQVWQRIPVLGRAQYQEIINEVQRNGGQPLVPANDPNNPLYISDIDTDWQREGLKNGFRQNHNINISGGGEYTIYNASVDFFGNTGTLVGNGPNYDRYSFRVNQTSTKGRFRVGTNIYYAHSDEDALSYRPDLLAGNRPPLIADLVQAIPTMPIYDPNNLGGFGGTEANLQRAISLNVIGANNMFHSTTTVDRMFSTGFAEYTIVDLPNHKLNYKLNLSYDRTQARDFSVSPAFRLGFFFNDDRSRLTDGHRILSTGLVENTFNYTGTFDKHNLDVLVGQMYQEGGVINRSGYSENIDVAFPVLDNGVNKQASGNEFRNAIASYLGRINYSYDDRYLVTATMRRDGSSRFAPAYRYGNFPSIAVGWKLHNEPYINMPSFISDLKVRGSWGQLGNANIGDYLYFATINPNVLYNFNGEVVRGSIQTSQVDPNIRWETRETSNFGFDATLFDGKVDISAEYYDSKTTDILVAVPIPASTGAAGSPVTNAGSLRNSGFEFQATYRKVTGEFTYDISGNLTTLRNEVLALGGTNIPIFGAGSRTIVGEPIGHHFGHRAIGIFQSQEEIDAHAFQSAGTRPGDVKFEDVNGDGVIDFAEDRVNLGSGLPTLYYGLNFSAAFRNFDFTLFTSGAGGYLIHSRPYRDIMLTMDFTNRHEDILQRWTPENPSTTQPRLVAGDPNQNQRNSDREGWLQDGTHLRIQTVSLGYTFNTIGNLLDNVQSLRVYFTAQNPYTFQAYKAYNPDFTSGVFNPGFDFGSFPRPRTLMLGLQVAF
ncbi:MAG TPA: TonB-dependent receptor [Anditalea sp.]|nr:TonB-dependent receptor [Anditalea sp.]